MIKPAVFALSVFLSASPIAHAGPTLFASGQFPVGNVYQAGSLESLVGRELPEASYLVGDFLYLGEMDGLPTFCTYAFSEDAPTKLEFGKTIIKVRFPGNFPAGLDVGKAIQPNANDPLTVLRVEKSRGGGWIIVTAESQSQP